MQDYQNNKRRNYFIDKKFQLKFIIKFCLLIISTSLLIGALTYLFNCQTTTVAFEGLRVVVKSTADFILPTILSIVAIVTIFVSIATIILSLFASHKISGPLYRLSMELEKMKNKDFSSIVSIRAQDQLQNLAFEFDGMRIIMKDSIRELKEGWLPAKIALNKLQEETKNKEEKKQIADNIERIDSILSKFKTD